jgi:5-methylcytosine-specific restriction protein A
MALGRQEFDMWCREHNEDPTDAIHEDGFRGLMEYEEQLRRKHRRRQRANRIWQQIEKEGFIGSTEARILGGRSGGFRTLMEAGLQERTDEFLVTQYPNEFSKEAVELAKARLDAWDRREIAPQVPARNPTWVRDELILALDLYLRYAGNPPPKGSAEIEELSKTLNRLGRYLRIVTEDRFRNVNGVYMKLMNFRRFDPVFTQAGKRGLPRGGQAEEAVWNEFATDPDRCRNVAQTIRQFLASMQEGETVAEPTGDEIEEAAEGRVITAMHRRYERSGALVQSKKNKALATFGRLACEACGFDFRERYGDRGEGFIECHHTKPVHTLKPSEKTKWQTFAYCAPTVIAWSMQDDIGSRSRSW